MRIPAIPAIANFRTIIFKITFQVYGLRLICPAAARRVHSRKMDKSLCRIDERRNGVWNRVKEARGVAPCRVRPGFRSDGNHN